MTFGEARNAPEHTANAEAPASPCGCCALRRGFLGAMAALGATAALPSAALAQGARKAAPKGKPFRIDVHHHLAYPGYLEEIGAQRAGAGFKWTPEMSLEEMEKSGIAVALLSIIQPGTAVPDAEKARHVARQANEYGAGVVRDHPGRFGMFATLPLADPDASLKEIEYGLDTLKAQGIGLMTSYGDKYLGDAAFAPVWQELDRRKAIVYTHPLTPQCCRNLVPDVPPGVVEYATDTTRTIASLVFSGTAARYPNIRWIFSHGGGTMPFLLSRFLRQEQIMKEREQRLPRGVLYELKKLYYDTAQANTPNALAAMVRFIPITQVLYGSDFPFRHAIDVNEGLVQFRFKPRDQRAIERDNAVRLIPTLKS